MTIQQFRPKSSIIDGLHIVLGQTTKRQILEFCPGANVGAPADESDRYSCGDCHGLDSKDLRWIILPNHDEGGDGDWIMRFPNGDCFLATAEHLEQFWERIP